MDKKEYIKCFNSIYNIILLQEYYETLYYYYYFQDWYGT